MKAIEREMQENPISKLIIKYSIPAILSGIVSALYNIVDQIFIGQSVGILGNAATNVSYPFVTIITSFTLLLGIGGASNFSLALGRKEYKKMEEFVGTAIFCMTAVGIFIAVVALIFLEPLLYFFGATESNFEYSYAYASILAFGFPFFILGTGASHLVRADGSPKISSKCIMTGAILNCFLDPLFIFVFDMGIEGAALATVISQVVSCVLIIRYLLNFKTFKITRSMIKFRPAVVKKIALLGMAPAFNQIALTITQIVMNNVLTYYGALSIYGSDIPLACVGVITKVNSIFLCISVGVAQGTQPIIGYNYSSKQYGKVMEAYKTNAKYVTTIACIAFLVFQIFPRQLTALFGSGSEEYFQFAIQYFRIYMFMTFVSGIQPITGTFFTSIGKPTRGLFISMTKQLIFLCPLVSILPIFFGIDGVLYAGPIADTAAFALSLIFITHEFKILKRKIKEKNQAEELQLIASE